MGHYCSLANSRGKLNRATGTNISTTYAYCLGSEQLRDNVMRRDESSSHSEFHLLNK